MYLAILFNTLFDDDDIIASNLLIVGQGQKYVLKYLHLISRYLGQTSRKWNSSSTFSILQDLQSL